MNRVIVMGKNEVGVLADITAPLASAGVNILTINTDSTGESDLIILTTEDNDAALEALTAAGFRAIIDETLIVRLRDEPGALARVAEKFKNAGINIQSLHIVERRAGFAILSLSVDDREGATALLDSSMVV